MNLDAGCRTGWLNNRRRLPLPKIPKVKRVSSRTGTFLHTFSQIAAIFIAGLLELGIGLLDSSFLLIHPDGFGELAGNLEVPDLKLYTHPTIAAR